MGKRTALAMNWKRVALCGIIAYLLFPLILMRDPSRIVDRPFPLLIWKIKYAKFVVTNPEAANFKLQSGVRLDYPFVGLEGPVTDLWSKEVGTTFRWLVFGYSKFHISLGCEEETCRSMEFSDREVKWFTNTIQLVPNKFPVRSVSARGYDWVISRKDKGVKPLPNNPEDTLYASGIQGRVDGADLVLEGKNGGRLFIVEGSTSGHDADWGDGRLVPEIRIAEYESRTRLFVIYFLNVRDTVFKCSVSGRVITQDSVTIRSSAINLGNGSISTTPRSGPGIGSTKYIQGYINGKPI